MGRLRPSRYSPDRLNRPAATARLAAPTAFAGAVGLLLAAALLRYMSRRLLRVIVEGPSMVPALQPGDRLLVWKGAALRPGDVVAARDPRNEGRTIVKRVSSVSSHGVWLEGDNRGQSTDSRHFGAVARALVEGRVLYRYAPPARAGRLRPEEDHAAGRVRGRDAGAGALGERLGQRAR